MLHFAQVRNACLFISTFRQLISIADRLTKELSLNGGIPKFRNPEGGSWEYVQVPKHLSVASDGQLSMSSSYLF